MTQNFNSSPYDFTPSPNAYDTGLSGPSPAPKKRRDGWLSILSTILIIIVAPVIAWLMIMFVFQSYQVDGQSMESTLSDSERLIVLKTDRTWATIKSTDYIPERYDIIVFVKRGMVDFGDTSERQLIKRVIGMPGERVVVGGGVITVYNRENPSGFNPDTNQEYAETITVTNGDMDIIVPDGEVFVAGDNRTNSLDSRTFGTVPSEDIVGRLIFRLLPLNRAESF